VKQNRLAPLFDDQFASSRMPLGDHLEELRRRLWLALIGFAVIVLAVFLLDGIGFATGSPIGVGRPVMEMIAAPVERCLQDFYDRRLDRVIRDLQNGQTNVVAADLAQNVPIDLEVNELAQALAPALGLPAPADQTSPQTPQYVRFHGRIPPVSWGAVLQPASRLIGHRPSLQVFSATEGMTVYFKVAVVCGVVLGSPWIFWQLWAFVAAGLYPREKRLVYFYLPFSLGLFLAGVLVCQFLVIPKAVETLLWFDAWLNFEPNLRLSEWLSFAIWMPLVFGIAFQTPLAMVMLERLGTFGVTDYRRARRVAWFALAVFAAVITPSVDPWSMLLLWLPLLGLYELGILLCLLPGRSGRVPRESVVDTPRVPTMMV
jgi:sec-independent protein translocase protein TatC